MSNHHSLGEPHSSRLTPRQALDVTAGNLTGQRTFWISGKVSF